MCLSQHVEKVQPRKLYIPQFLSYCFRLFDEDCDELDCDELKCDELVLLLSCLDELAFVELR